MSKGGEFQMSVDTVAAARKFCTYLYWMLKEECSYTEWLRQHDRPEVRAVQPLGSAA